MKTMIATHRPRYAWWAHTSILLMMMLSGLPARGVSISLTNRICLSCHSRTIVSGYIDPARYSQSVHRNLKCTDCHRDFSINRLPHPATAAPVNCVSCHLKNSGLAARFADIAHRFKMSIHHQIAVAEHTTLAPTCATCHGRHEILPASDPRSKVNRRNIPFTCAHCHNDPRLVDRFRIPKGHVLIEYERSVHGQLLLGQGMNRAAVCTDCHRAHDIQPADVAGSSVSRNHIPYTCGRCHPDKMTRYLSGVHGQAFLKEVRAAPVCTDCHGEHTIRAPTDRTSSVYPTNIPNTCGRCHANKAIDLRFGLPADRLSTFRSSYHGTALTYGIVTVANCATCHRAHEVLPASDPRSSINPKNIPATCGRCHKHAGANFARGEVHMEVTPAGNLGVYLMTLFYRVVIWSMTILFFGLIGLDLWARRRESKRNRGGASAPAGHSINTSHDAARLEAGGAEGSLANTYVERMPLQVRIQHVILLISVGTLMATGFLLQYSQTDWARFLLSFPGGFELRAWLHRAGAVLLITAAIYHLIYLAVSKSSRKDIMMLMPNRKDLRDFTHQLQYYFGLAPDRPQFGRFGYAEKFEYLSLTWGTIVMVVTGAVLWFMSAALHWLPLWAWQMALVMHGFEALLAFIAIVTWHLYWVHFNPSVFPMSSVWITGKISLHQMREEHPLEYEELMQQQSQLMLTDINEAEPMRD